MPHCRVNTDSEWFHIQVACIGLTTCQRNTPSQKKLILQRWADWTFASLVNCIYLIEPNEH